jgi:uncharacterized OsmC-like protein
MARIDGEKLKSNYEAVVSRLRANDAMGLMHPYVSAQLIEDVSVSLSFEQYDREFTFYGDEAIDRGGHERGPSPMRYFLSGIAFCMLGWYAKGSGFAGCDVEEMEMDIRSFLDMRGEHGFAGHAVHPQWLIFDIRVTSPSSPESVLAMVDWGDERCPLGAFARRAVPVFEAVTHNDVVIRNTVPPEVE